MNALMSKYFRNVFIAIPFLIVALLAVFTALITMPFDALHYLFVKILGKLAGMMK